MRRSVSTLYCLLLIMGLGRAQMAESQSRTQPVGDCGADICLETGMSNWQYTPSQYCSSGVCLQDSLASLLSLDWEEMTAGQDALSLADANPFIGLTDGEYQRLRELGDDDVEERVQLLGKIRVSCQIGEFSLGLDIPGRDIVEVTFGTSSAENGGSQQFQVIRIDRLYRSFAGGSMGWWIRWLSYRYPGIVLMEGSPTAFANYEMGLFVGKVVLYDLEFRSGQPEEYGKHPDCAIG